MNLLFTGKYCKSCPTVKHQLNTMGVQFIEVDVEDETVVPEMNQTGRALQMQWRIMGLPTLVKVQSGTPIDRLTGVYPEGSYRKFLK